MFGSALDLARSLEVAVRPQRELTVAESARSVLRIHQPGGYSGQWSPEETPYMVGPMNALASRRHEAVCFVGPSRTGKTMGLLDGWLARNVVYDPGDMMICHMTEDDARKYSKQRIDRAIKNSPQLRAMLGRSSHDDNVHDKFFKNGMYLNIIWPSSSKLSGTDYKYVAFTDYDRIPDDIDGEGSGFVLGLKRTQTFMSRGMALFESSPGRDLSDPHWRPATPHEAPPVTGIVGIYNRSDRHRWYWQCPDCSEYFEAAPGLALFSSLPDERELMEEVRTASLPAMAAHHANVICPHCGSIIEQRHKPHLNRIETARWVADGQSVTRDGDVIGDAPASSIAGFWLGGVAAAYQKWDSLILRYLQGLREYAMSGSDLTLKATINTDQGMPYLPRHLLQDKGASVEDRTEEIERYHVPEEARFLVATADVQGGSAGRFVCEVRAFGPHLESWLVDRFSITTTERNGVAAQVDPAGYPEDWDLLTEKMVRATYRLHDGREMRVLRTAVDTGGESGTTPNAYQWLRRLRQAGLSSRVMLVKGGSNDKAKPVTQGTARDNKGKAMRDMPLWLVNTDYFKDLIAASLRRQSPGPGYFHAPDWLPTSYFDELKAEIRQANGKWKKVRARNEALDLWVYALAAVEALGFGPRGRLKWDDPPPWALPQDDGNSEVIDAEERRAERATPTTPIQDTQRAVPPQKPVTHNDDALFSPIALTR